MVLEPKTREAPQVSKWSNRFIWAAIIQGLAATVLTIPIVYPWLNPPVSRVIAAGSAGTWFLLGYSMYIMVGVLGVGLTALFYHHFEVVLGHKYTGAANMAAWVHLVLMNVGAAAATWLLMYGGYFGEAALMAGQTSEYVHVNILSPLVNPIGALVVVTGIGVLAGGLGFLIAYMRK